LTRAAAVLSAIFAEAAIRRSAVPRAARACRTELSFWQGSLDETAASDVDELAGLCERFHWCTHLSVASRVERQLARGDHEHARAAIESRLASRDLCVLDRSLLLILAARCATDGRPRIPEEVDRFIRLSGARGLLRWALGGRDMDLLRGISTLLQVVQDADDEYVALRHGCSWVREHVEADAVGIVEANGTAVIAGAGFAAAELANPDVRSSLAREGARTVADGPTATVTAPMRYGGTTIGFAIVRGRREAVETLGATAAALASVCAPALRARLDALALAANGQTLVAEILGRSTAMTALRQATAKAAATMFPVLIEGGSSPEAHPNFIAVSDGAAARDGDREVERAREGVRCSARTVGVNTHRVAHLMSAVDHRVASRASTLSLCVVTLA
jgi:hypothetical protein